MGGVGTFGDAGSGNNDYVVAPEIAAGIYYKAVYATVFGKLNGVKEIKSTKIGYGAEEVTIDAGNDSPVWEKTPSDNAEVRFTMRERNSGMFTYGDADLKPGDFAKYKYSTCFVRQSDSPIMPIPGFESQENFKRVINDFVTVEKDNISDLVAREKDKDGFRSILCGASRGLLLTTDGGRGISLYGGSAGVVRSCYNTYVEGQTGLTAQSAVLATHESNLATALGTLSDAVAYQFDYDSHKRNSFLIDELKFKPVKIGGSEYRAVALIDIRNLYRLDAAGGTLATLFQNATARGAENKSIYHRGQMVLDDILYVPCKQLDWFRPAVSGSTVSYGCGITQDPEASGFSNASNITITAYLGAGATLRGRRKGVSFTSDPGKHGKGANYAFHFHDGWTRNDWFAKDGRIEMDNDSSLVCFNYDKGVGTSYAA